MNRRERIMQGMSGGTTAPPRRSQLRQQMGGDLHHLDTIAPMSYYREGASPVGQNFQAALGQQLSNRVDNGVISEAQARKTARERQLLQNAFGSNWRTKVFGAEGARGLQSEPFGVADIRTRRLQALERARQKLA